MRLMLAGSIGMAVVFAMGALGDTYGIYAAFARLSAVVVVKLTHEPKGA